MLLVFDRELALTRVRDRRRLQNGWNFGKIPKAFDPPPSSLENHIAKFASKLRQKCACSLWRDCCVLYDPIYHEMHVVQQFNMVIGWKTYHQKTLLYRFHAEKAQILQYNFLDWKWTPSPLSEFFWKFIRFGGGRKSKKVRAFCPSDKQFLELLPS